MTALRNALAHLAARWYLWRSLLRTTQHGDWSSDPNASGEYDAPTHVAEMARVFIYKGKVI